MGRPILLLALLVMVLILDMTVNDGEAVVYILGFLADFGMAARSVARAFADFITGVNR